MLSLTPYIEVFSMLKIIIALVRNLSTFEADVESVVNEVRDNPDALSKLKGAAGALRKLADDIEKAIEA
jgi:hypothetical protein